MILLFHFHDVTCNSTHNAYLSFLEEQLDVEIKIVSVGPDREQTIERYTEE